MISGYHHFRKTRYKHVEHVEDDRYIVRWIIHENMEGVGSYNECIYAYIDIYVLLLMSYKDLTL